jgi:hypothetical protein
MFVTLDGLSESTIRRLSWGITNCSASLNIPHISSNVTYYYGFSRVGTVRGITFITWLANWCVIIVFTRVAPGRDLTMLIKVAPGSDITVLTRVAPGHNITMLTRVAPGYITVFTRVTTGLLLEPLKPTLFIVYYFLTHVCSLKRLQLCRLCDWSAVCFYHLSCASHMTGPFNPFDIWIIIIFEEGLGL